MVNSEVLLEKLWKIYATEEGMSRICFILSGDTEPKIIGYYFIDQTGEVTIQTRYNSGNEVGETGTK